MDRPYKIVFYQRGTEANGVILRERPLGGTESAMIEMAEALAKRGHEVRVFCETKRLDHLGVAYHPWRSFEDFALHREFDVFLCVRDLLLPFARKWAPVQICFSPDAMDQPALNEALRLNLNLDGMDHPVGLFSLKEVHPRADAVFCVGSWQKATFQQKFRVPAHKIYVAGNGVSEEFFFKSRPLQERARRLVYASTPYRGLEHLVDYWPAIRARVPDAECFVLSGMQIYGLSGAEDEKSYGALYEKARASGITFLGARDKRAMAEVFSSSRVMAYPNTFAETFCMAALEAQSCGLPVISTDLAGLKERVQSGVSGYLIPGHPREGAYREEFIERTVALLCDDEAWCKMSEQAVKAAEGFLYGKLATLWEEEFERLMAQSSKLTGYYDGNYAVELATLIGGYSKKVHISHQAVLQCMAQCLRQVGLEQSSGHFAQKSIISLVSDNKAVS